MPAIKKYVMECLGTFALVFLVSGALVLYEGNWSFAHSPRTVALVYGIALFGLTLVLGKATGAHLNPAVTLAYSLDKVLPWRETLPYILSQCIGALAAAGLLRLCFPHSVTLGAVLPLEDPASAFTIEYCITTVLITGILAVPKDTPGHLTLSAFVAAALTIVIVLLLGPLNGSSMNPARALGPALISGQTDDLWLYLTAPLCAAATAAGLHSLFNHFRPPFIKR